MYAGANPVTNATKNHPQSSAYMRDKPAADEATDDAKRYEHAEHHRVQRLELIRVHPSPRPRRAEPLCRVGGNPREQISERRDGILTQPADFSRATTGSKTILLTTRLSY